MRTLIIILFLASWVSPAAFCQSDTEVSGIIIPRDNEGMYVRNDQGQFEAFPCLRTCTALALPLA